MYMQGIIPLTTYDLFIQSIDEKNIIKEYSIYDDKYSMSVDCISHLKVECEELPNYTDNYKLMDGQLIKLTDEEKPKPIPPQPNKISILEKEMEDLKSSQMGQDFIIDDLVFEVIPMLETQINIVRDSGNGEDTPVLLPSVMANKIINNNKKEGGGMAAYLAKKIIDGRDYIAVFRTLSYKMYQEEVNTILELEGHGNLIKR
ncbi:MAG: hypothetical protein RSE41_06805 [Clostridia bacterium]